MIKDRFIYRLKDKRNRFSLIDNPIMKDRVLRINQNLKTIAELNENRFEVLINDYSKAEGLLCVDSIIQYFTELSCFIPIKEIMKDWNEVRKIRVKNRKQLRRIRENME